MKQIVENVPFSSLRSGDVIQAGYSQAGTVNVEREFPDPPEPEPTPEPGFGTAIVNGKRVRGYIDADGDFGHLDRYGHNTYDTYTDFVPDSDEKPEPAKPQITWEHFINTMNQTVFDNGLNVGPDFVQAIVFGADRLGLR